jgi:hypothetical protein
MAAIPARDAKGNPPGAAETLLPWSTPLIVLLLAFVIHETALPLWDGRVRATAAEIALDPYHRFFMILGAAIADRLLRSRVRAVRWAVGMAVGAAICRPGLTGFGTETFLALSDCFYQALATLLLIGGGALTGWLLGAVALPTPRRYWTLPLAALVGGQVTVWLFVLGELTRVIVLPYQVLHLGMYMDSAVRGALVAGVYGVAFGLILGVWLAIGEAPSAPPQGQAASEATTLPPSPLGVREVDVPFFRVLLPDHTPLLTLGAALLGGVPAAVLAVYLQAPWILEEAAPGVAMAAWRGFLFALGAVLGDRLAPSWPRPARWGLGMALSGLVPDPYRLRYTDYVSPGEWLAVYCAHEAIRGGLLGTALGLTTRHEAGAVWKSLGAGTVLLAVFVALDIRVALRNPVDIWVSPLESAASASALLIGEILLPVVLANRLLAAWKHLSREAEG